jgi:farnesyl diphosphate synthase
MANKIQMLSYQQDVEKALDEFLQPQKDTPAKLLEAMRYSALGGGKRVRAGFVYMVGQALGAPQHIMNHPAAAIEMIHAFSLIHDDLPAIDNDDLRRHKPTSHIMFGEAMAILAGDCLQARAFEILASTPDLPAAIVVRMVKVLAEATGASGIIGGEVFDVLAKANSISQNELLTIHLLKTAKLFRASVLLGALSANCEDEKVLNCLAAYAINLGIAFQIQDDVIEVESSSEVMGKSKTDTRNETNTAVTVMGLTPAKHLRDEYYHNALEALHQTNLQIPDLLNLSRTLVERAA